jgi:hypothetical protein
LEWVGSGGEVPSVEERDGERFLVHGEKWGGYRGSVGDDFIPCMTIFFAIGEGIEKLLKLLLTSTCFVRG